MADPVPFRRPIHWERLRTDEAEQLVRERAAETSNVNFGEHAFEIEQRTITQVDVYDILRTGMVEGDPQQNEQGDWEIIVVKRMPGLKDAGAVTIVCRNDALLFVKTVEWMDWNR